ncbi:MAG: pyridoxal phosphate-dependent aminotransferase [Candidatus Methanomethyliaceae archaeon]|nr:pyridoxal phosphate-dependent aminotransferase [Candidatus Methanomethyliaceae archaeon]MDW7970720.1 pyridoxal phosphate-dependent aminotransferase [Nitrososphaerota archaeon]
MSCISEILDAISESGIRRLFELASKEENVISLGIGEPDFDTPQFIKDYAIEALNRGMTHYTPNSGIRILREAISEKLKKENGIFADPDKNIMITIGANQAFFLVLSTFIKPGDEIIIPSPYFVTHAAAARLVGGKVVEIETKIEEGFKLLPERVKKSITNRTKCIIICTPNNPTGAIIGRKELEEIANIAIEHNLKIISDEVYEKLIYDNNRHFSIASLNGISDRVITINSFSKTFAMTGWRIGYVVADERTIAKMIKFQMYLAACPTSFAQYAAAMALRDSKSAHWIEEMRREYERRRNFLYKRLCEIDGFTVYKPEGAFYIFPKIGLLDDNKIAERILKEAKVVVVPGSAFGTYGLGHLRLCYTLPIEKLEEACNRIEEFMMKI